MPKQDDTALSHIRICDFTGQLAGAGATRILATFGAQVIRVEDPVARGKWDILRGTAPFIDERRGDELGGAFNNHNVEKLGITINTRTGKGKDLLRRLIAISDVVGENFSGGVMDRWGFSYERMAEINPKIIYVSNSGFGKEGPYAKYKTWGPIVQAVGGLTYNSGFPGMTPAGWGYSYMDHTGGYFMAIAILAALCHRNRTGEGQWIDMACTDTAAALNGPAMLDYTVNGRPLSRPGSPDTNHNDSPVMVPHYVYRCAGEDNWVAIAARDERDWFALCDAIDRPAWKADARLSTARDRKQHEAEIDRAIEEWTCTRQHRDVMWALQARGVPAGFVQRPRDRIEDDENARAWGLWPEVTHPEMGRVKVDGVPLKLSRTPARLRHGAPLLGQHNDFVYGDLLKMSKTEIDTLRQEQVI